LLQKEEIRKKTRIEGGERSTGEKEISSGYFRDWVRTTEEKVKKERQEVGKESRGPAIAYLGGGSRVGLEGGEVA